MQYLKEQRLRKTIINAIYLSDIDKYIMHLNFIELLQNEILKLACTAVHTLKLQFRFKGHLLTSTRRQGSLKFNHFIDSIVNS